jgi:hypothetical protein
MTDKLMLPTNELWQTTNYIVQKYKIQNSPSLRKELKKGIRDKLAFVNYYKQIISQIDYIVDNHLIEQVEASSYEIERIESNRRTIVDRLEKIMGEKLEALERGETPLLFNSFYLFRNHSNAPFELKVVICQLQLHQIIMELFIEFRHF